MKKTETILVECPYCGEHLGEYFLDPIENSNALDHYRDQLRQDHYNYDCIEFLDDRVNTKKGIGSFVPRRKKIF